MAGLTPILLIWTIVTFASAAGAFAENAGSPQNPVGSPSALSPGQSESLQEAGTGIQPFNFHGPAQPPTSGTESFIVGQRTPARDHFSPTPPAPNAPVSPLVPLGPHTTVVPQAVPPPSFGQGRR